MFKLAQNDDYNFNFVVFLDFENSVFRFSYICFGFRASNFGFLTYSGSPLSMYIAAIAGLGLPNPPNQRS